MALQENMTLPATGTIAGIDEAGRGPWAGAVVAAVVVLEAGQRIDGVRDSKLLTPALRERAADRIRKEARAWAIGRAEVAEIDALNVLRATLLAMDRAVGALGCRPDLIRVDGNQRPALPGFDGPVETWIGGDRRCPAISAASILAKVARDAEMTRLDRLFPGYGFARHKGYGTAEHQRALDELGPCDLHRASFRPVQLALTRHERA
jgi:ribonuclease HII